jgi:serine/threonine protein kinase
LEEYRARELILKIGQALEYLHDNGVILKNLNASGILMTEVTKNMEL